jgi:cellulose synthase/poly-beta-1,6-N-acetylglucosamine synthase-like glycosyltransferase
MIYIALFVLAFTAIQLLVAVSNLIFRPKLNTPYSRTDELVSVMIPARNEETNILKILTDLQHQSHSALEILVYDDQSTDRTASLVSEMANYDKRIKLISSQGLPEGWLGKNHACYQMSQQATGKYFLL